MIRVLLAFTLFLNIFSSYVFATPVRYVTEQFKPFQYSDEHGKLLGASVEIIDTLHGRMGEELGQNIEVYPWARAYNVALKQRNVMIFTISKTAARLNKFEWVYSYSLDNAPYLWILRNRTQGKDITWRDATKFTTSIPRNDTNLDLLLNRGFVENKNIFVTNDFEQSIKMLRAGRVDFMLAGNVSMVMQLSSLDIPKDEFKKIAITGVRSPKLSFAFSKGSDKSLIKKYRAEFRELDRAGEIDRILKKYLQSYDFNVD